MFYNICYYFIAFICFSFLGWCVETVACSLTKRKLVLNRGFLIGPYCPIYGTGAILAILCLKGYYNDPIALFVFAVVGASILEYLTSYLMEKLFNARWWDYSHMKFNINGRIVLSNSILFGLMGLFFIYLVNPLYESMIGKISPLGLEILAIILFIIFLTDMVVSFFVISKLKLNTKKLKDSTEEISEQVRAELRKNSVLKKRLLNAFPKMKTNYGDAIIDNVRKTLDDIKQKTNKKNRLKK